MFEVLSQRFQSLLKNLSGQGKISEKNIKDALRDVRLALLEADVHYSVVKEFVERVKQKALGQAVWDSLTPGQQFLKIVHDEIVELLGKHKAEIYLASQPPTVFMLVGLQGSGKTTTCAKLAHYYKNKKGKTVLLLSMDLQRPAAQDQLEILGKQMDIPFTPCLASTPVGVAALAREEAAKKAAEILILDTAGRLHVDEALMAELVEAKEKLKPHYVILVLDAMTGQDAVNQAKVFKEKVGIDGVILTKLDGDSKGGAALSVTTTCQVPIWFAGMGEKADNLEPFYPDRLAGRILNRGDVLSLVEKVQETVQQQEIEDLEQKFRKDAFTLDDFMKQIRMIKKMGPLSDLVSMIPGMGQAMPQVDEAQAEKQMKKTEAMILSMTPFERNNPSQINGRRRSRIALGSGTSVEEVNRLLKQFFEAQKMMKQMKGKKGSMFKV